MQAGTVCVSARCELIDANGSSSSGADAKRVRNDQFNHSYNVSRAGQPRQRRGRVAMQCRARPPVARGARGLGTSREQDPSDIGKSSAWREPTAASEQCRDEICVNRDSTRPRQRRPVALPPRWPSTTGSAPAAIRTLIGPGHRATQRLGKGHSSR